MHPLIAQPAAVISRNHDGKPPRLRPDNPESDWSLTAERERGQGSLLTAHVAGPRQKPHWHHRILLTSISFSIIIIFFILYRAKKQRQIESNIQFAKMLSSRILQLDNDISVANESIKTLLATRFTFFNRLCQLVIENNDSPVSRRRISETVNQLIKDLSSNPTTIRDLEKFVDLHYSNIFAQFKSDLPNLKESNYNLFLFSILGFTDNVIAYILKKENVSTIYSARRHLKDKIKLLDEPKKSRYLNCL